MFSRKNCVYSFFCCSFSESLYTKDYLSGIFLDKVKELQHQFYETAVRLEEEQGKNLKLRAQINRDYENSSIPSSKTLRKKKITNSREKTGRKPGGQPGHKGHCRKKTGADPAGSPSPASGHFCFFLTMTAVHRSIRADSFCQT